MPDHDGVAPGGEGRVPGAKATSHLGGHHQHFRTPQGPPRRRPPSGAAGCRLPAVEGVTTGFFRMERVTMGGRAVHLALAGNPTVCTEVLRALLGDGQPRHMPLGLNDRASWPRRQGYVGAPLWER